MKGKVINIFQNELFIIERLARVLSVHYVLVFFFFNKKIKIKIQYKMRRLTFEECLHIINFKYYIHDFNNKYRYLVLMF